MTTFVCRVTEDLRYRVGSTTDGRDFRPIGPLFTTPREALTYIAALQAMPAVSPLRASEGESKVPPFVRLAPQTLREDRPSVGDR